MKTDPDKLTKKHKALVQSDLRKVVSHVQRNDGDWIVNTVMIEACDAPFRFKRQKPYKNLKGALVNLTYYPTTELVGGIEFEVMNVVRIRVS